MTTIHIGQRIAALRHERAITQEQLAQAVGVSAPAVSKWETGQSYPDIALLPPLARYFGVTVDALLAYVPSLTDEDREAHAGAVEDTFEREGWAAGLAMCDALLREYPDDVSLRVLLACQLMQGKAVAPDEAARAEGGARQIRWLEEASAVPGPMQRMAQNLLGTFYIQMQRLDEAEATLTPLLEYQSNTHKLMPTLRLMQGRYDDAARLAQHNLLADAMDMVNDAGTLAGICRRQDDLAGSLRYIEVGEAVARAMEMPRFFRLTVAQHRMSHAEAAGDAPAQLGALEDYVDALLAGTMIDDTPLLDRIPRDGEPSRPPHEDAVLGILAGDLRSNARYAAIRDDPRFAALLARLPG